MLSITFSGTSQCGFLQARQFAALHFTKLQNSPARRQNTELTI